MLRLIGFLLLLASCDDNEPNTTISGEEPVVGQPPSGMPPPSEEEAKAMEKIFNTKRIIEALENAETKYKKLDKLCKETIDAEEERLSNMAAKFKVEDAKFKAAKVLNPSIARLAANFQSYYEAYIAKKMDNCYNKFGSWMELYKKDKEEEQEHIVDLYVGMEKAIPGSLQFNFVEYYKRVIRIEEDAVKKAKLEQERAFYAEKIELKKMS